MPIVVQYGGSVELTPPAPEDEDNIVDVLKQSGRVSSIGLTVTSSLLKKLSSIKRPFSELEGLVLLSRDGVRLTLPITFRWGPRLRCLHLTGITFPAFQQLLYSSRNLVDLQLHEALHPLLLSPEALANILSRMAQLRSLLLHFLYTDYYPTPPPPSGKCVVLPVLTCLDFRGYTKYLGGLMARIDCPRLENIKVTLFYEIHLDLSTLGKFIGRMDSEIHKSSCRADIVSSERAISFSLIQPGAPTSLKFQLFCGSLRRQLFSLAQICTHLPTLLSNVEDLHISATWSPSGGLADGDFQHDVLFLPFGGTKWLQVSGNLSIVNITHHLQLLERQGKTALPALYKLCIPQPGSRLAPLSGGVVSFMTSRQLSGRPIAVEYERLRHISGPRGTGPFPHEVTIEMLSDDIFLNIFCYYLDGAPRTWPTLTYVCHRWRQIVHTSPLGLNLRLYYCWPALPIVVQYGGLPDLAPPSPEDDDNIMAALKQSGRVNSISLTVTSSLLGKLSAISEPFLELEELVLLSRDNMRLPLPRTFRWGPRLRTLHSTRNAFPSLPQLLSHSHDLVDIQLHEIPSGGYFSPEAFADALSGMTHLRTLSLHFLSLPPRRNYLSLPPSPPSGERVVLPALMFLKYRGTSKYLDSFVARIDAPGLGDIDITLFSQPTMDASQLGRFVERTGIQMPLSRADVQISADAISIFFFNSSTPTPLRLQISCKQLDWQLSSMAQVCDQFSPFLFRVNNPRINMTQSSSGQDDADSEQWLEFIRAFGGATGLPVAGELTTVILCALGLVEEGHITVLPSLRHLHIENPMEMNEPSWDGLLSFITLRSRSGHPVQVNVTFYQCYICHASFREQKGLDRHHIDKHAYRYRCLYCDDFEYTPGHKDLFREHLERKHPESVRNDILISDSFLRLFNLSPLVDRHSSLRAPESHPPPR
ncbi:hypothetical protein EDB89DRAFT_1905993 [Lactarius sanguifluus]|nr:hypothetical protein EDB89DRAFT_1905993 [Lactarius sanguifluus]